MSTIAYSQTAAFKTCSEVRIINASGNDMLCSARIDGQFCELGHIQNLDSMSNEEYNEILETECEHGLSAWLCAGPGHYPADNHF